MRTFDYMYAAAAAIAKASRPVWELSRREIIGELAETGLECADIAALLKYACGESERIAGSTGGYSVLALRLGGRLVRMLLVVDADFLLTPAGEVRVLESDL